MSSNEDYNIDPNTYDGEFFQEDGLEGYFEIDLTGVIEMEVHDDEMVDDEDADEEVRNAKDLELLERLQLGDDNEDEIPPLEHGFELLDCVIVMMRHMIQLIPMKMIISNTCMIHTN